MNRKNKGRVICVNTVSGWFADPDWRFRFFISNPEVETLGDFQNLEELCQDGVWKSSLSGFLVALSGLSPVLCFPFPSFPTPLPVVIHSAGGRTLESRRKSCCGMRYKSGCLRKREGFVQGAQLVSDHNPFWPCGLTVFCLGTRTIKFTLKFKRGTMILILSSKKIGDYIR